MGETWWGNNFLRDGDIGFWQIGPLDLYCRHHGGEWQLAWKRHPERDQALSSHKQVPFDGAMPDDLGMERFALQHASGGISFSPMMPDRCLVVRPKRPFLLPAREKARVYVRLPLWVRIVLVDGRGIGDRVLRDVTVQRLSDTWFGPSMFSGELLYACPDEALIGRPSDIASSHTSLICVEVANDSDEQLPIERIYVPATSLSVFLTSDQELVSENIAFSYLGHRKFSEIQVRPNPLSSQMRLLSSPRERVVKTIMGVAVDKLFTSHF